MTNPFEKQWADAQRAAPPPHFLREVRTQPFEAFQRRVADARPDDVAELVSSLYSGDSWILTDAFDAGVLTDLRHRVHHYGQRVPPAAHRIVDGCPNYHEIADESLARPRGGYAAYDHSYYFFRWNEDPLGIFAAVSRVWRAVKRLSGLDEDAYEGNLPSDGVVDRIQVIHYPSGVGRITVHSDPFRNQKVIAGAMLTTPGHDYDEGGFFILGRDKKPLNFEAHISLGSVVIAYPGMFHGVETIDPGSTANWNDPRGRWYMALYSPDSHCREQRETALPPERWADE